MNHLSYFSLNFGSSEAIASVVADRKIALLV